MTFDANRPEAFKYKLNNSASLSLVTNSGTTVALLLSGVVNQNGEDVEILEAKLEIECVSSDETRRFRLMAQSHSEEDGQRVAEWSIDLSQMGEFYSYMNVEDEQVADVKGVLTVKMSKSQTEVAATDFVQTIDDVAVSFETVAIVLNNKSMALSSVKVAGRVERSGAELGTFSMLKSENQEFGEFNLKLDLR